MALERSVARDDKRELTALLRRQGVACVAISSEEDLPDLRIDSSGAPITALVAVAYMTAIAVGRRVEACGEAEAGAIALVPRGRVPNLNPDLPLDDFIVSPPDPDELVARARRAIRSSRDDSDQDSNLIRAGDLQIDTSSYEVTIRGKRVGLRFKEYELLKLLAENPGRVFSRDALLNNVWGYEYFGGTRTVDVHIRRLRSKIEDSEHNFIETIWNVGYRFRGSR